MVTVGGAEVASQVLGGKLKCLGILGADRLKPLPDVPTFKEMGYDIEAYTHRGLVGPKGISQDVADALYQGFSKAMQEKEFIEGMENLGLGIFALNSQGYKEFIEKQSAAILKSLKKIGLIE